jgi:hypothetical protein
LEGFSSRTIGTTRQVRGVWQGESFDRVVRNEAEYRQKRDYILGDDSAPGRRDHISELINKVK